MTILHYTIGFPPVRSGGLIRYSLDLVAGECEYGEDLVILVPGMIPLRYQNRNNISIKNEGKWRNARVYKIINPLPIPMANGIQDVKWYTSACDQAIYDSFLRELKPDIIHIHSLMGLHREFLLAAKMLDIPIVYTTHDYFGLCPKADLMYRNDICNNSGINCIECNNEAFSKKRLLLEQSTVYRLYRKNAFFIKLLKSSNMKKMFSSLRSDPVNNIFISDKKDVDDKRKYVELLDYYKQMFSNISFYHFNSSIAKQVYELHLGELTGAIEGICNNSISDNRKIKHFGSIIKIGFLGGDYYYKGLNRLIDAIQYLKDNGYTKLELHIYGNENRTEHPFCIYHERYSHKELGKVFDNIHILAAPSSCMETFGMVVLEALSYGVPVLITDKVGAKDIINNLKETIGFIINDSDEAIVEAITKIYNNPDILNTLNANIVNAKINLSFINHVKSIIGIYNEVKMKKEKAYETTS